ncbi:MAG: hypothetical protein JWM53_1537, partial [bacterium]|nr:hypothetical protein [bacterium]
MKWASALSEAQETSSALSEATTRIARELGGVEPDLVVVFVSPHHAEAYESLPSTIAAAFPRALLFGCSAAGVIGAGHEVEERPALSLTAAVLPGVALRPLVFADAPDDGPEASAEAWRARVGLAVDEDPQFLLVGDPFTFDANALVAGLDAAYPAGRKVGGVASGGSGPGQNALYAGPQLQRVGAVGVA